MERQANSPAALTKSSADAFLLGDAIVQPSLSLIGEDQVEPRAMGVLQHLIDAQPNPVSIAELLDSVWEDTVVIENVVHQAIARLRRALGDRADTPKYIRTIPRKGYQLIAEVRSMPASEPDLPEHVEPSPISGNWLRFGMVLVAVLGIAFTSYTLINKAPELQMHQAPTVQVRGLDYEKNNSEAQTVARAIGQDIIDQLGRTRLNINGEVEAASDIDYVVGGFLRRVDVGWRLSVDLKELTNGRVVWIESTDLPEDVQQFDRAPYVARVIEAAANINEFTKGLPTQNSQTKEHYFAGSMEWSKLGFGGNGNWQVAINHFERTTELEDNFLPGHMFLAAIYANRAGGRMDAESALPLAREQALRVLSIDPRQTFIRGQVLIDLELAYDAARSYLEAAKQTQIPLGVIEEQLCKVEYTRGAFTKAIDHCRTALQMGASPDQVSTLHTLGRVLGSVERYSEALANYAEAANTRGEDLIVSGSVWQAALTSELNAVKLLVDMGDPAAAVVRLDPLLSSQTITAYPEVFAGVFAKLGRVSDAKALLAGAEKRLIRGARVDNSAMFFGYHYLGEAAMAAPWLSRLISNREWWTIGELRGYKLQEALSEQTHYAGALVELARIEEAAALIPLVTTKSPNS